MPATPGMVIGFIAYLFDNGRACATITSYISAVAYFHKIQGYTDPTTSFLESEESESESFIRFVKPGDPC